jgi:3-phenylpropionate/trans-cinnamate dioxygenase ferredoxin reductase subunit
MLTYKYVIVGGGLTAGYAAKEFANFSIPEGELCILSAEDTLPYERPPLSKGFLAGDKTKEEILINDQVFYERQGIEIKLGTPVKRVDLENKKLFVNGEVIGYEKLLIATGARPRTLDIPGSDLENIFYLRTIKDARHIHQRAREATKGIVVGGGFIGMEATSVLQSLGVETTMVFPDKRVWETFFTKKMSDYFEKYYRERGVTILPEMTIDLFLGKDRVTHVETSTGQRLEADIVVVGIGALLNTEIFQDSGVQITEDGIRVNRFLETNVPDVLAAGDVTRYMDVLYKRPMHIEHWDNAVEQGKHAARVMLGEYQPYEHVPYFFSDEFDLSFEFWGNTQGAAEEVHRGDVSSGHFSVWWLSENGRLLASFVMNRPEEERIAAPRWIKSGKKLQAKWLQETNVLLPDEV